MANHHIDGIQPVKSHATGSTATTKHSNAPKHWDFNQALKEENQNRYVDLSHVSAWCSTRS